MGHSPDGLALPDKRKTSIWLALKNPVFKGYWLAALISGTCVAAHNTAAFSVLGEESDSTLLISLMSTLSSLPFALFTLPAGALADMVERKKILHGTCLWQASVALCLAILALTDLLSSHVILVSVFLFGIGFAFASPASASVEVEMVPPEHLASANTLGGLQMNIAGIIGPLIGGLLVSLSGTRERIRGQRWRFPLALPGSLALEEAGTRGRSCTRRFLCHHRNGDSLRALHPWHQGGSGPDRPFLVLHLHHSSAYAGGRLEGTALGRIATGLSFHGYGDWLSGRSGLHHADSAGAPFAK